MVASSGRFDAADEPITGAVPHNSVDGIHWLMRRLGNRWTFPILDVLRHGPMRFASLKRTLDPVSQRMLTLSLRNLEQDGLVYRQKMPVMPLQVAYGLTPAGVVLVGRLEEFEAWMVSYKPTPEPPTQD